MRDIMGMMGKVKEMQAKMEQMQAEIAELQAEGKAGGGLVTLVMSGKGELKSLKIDPSLFKEDDVEILEDLIVAAHKDAKDKAEAAAAEKTKALTAGLPIPPGLLKAALWLLKSLRLTRLGPGHVKFIQYRPVLANHKLKTEFGFTPQFNALEVFERYRAGRPEPDA